MRSVVTNFRAGLSRVTKFRVGRWLVIATAFLLGACSPTDMAPPQLGTAPALDGSDLPTVDLFGTVTLVADGDSLRAVVDDEEIEVRLLGINAPEREECFGPESSQWLAEMIEGREIRLVVEGQDQFDRTLARVLLDTTNVNVEAVATGHALVVSEVNVGREALLEAEQRARSSGSGLWGDNICGASGQKATLEIVDIDYNPPGPDEVETVTIENTGAETIDLEGFTLRDESSINRYVLPAELLTPGERYEVRTSTCEFPQSHGPAWCSDEPVWNNGGDTAMLLDPFGRIVALLRY